ncbi:aminotransferase class IV [Nonomuraea sp. NPDC001831]|uniref:aminotransferase class IV n=1 Tax=Nonomuraea sp. NPDC001831 TaxID=3364340 RepID=UPI0036D1027C
MIVRAVVEGRPVDADARFALEARYGHFTAMQVRDRRTRGLALHLERLAAANLELFGARLDPAAVLGSIRAVLGDDLRDAGVRVYVVEHDGRPRVVATAAPPTEVSARPQRVTAVVYQRYLPHIKKAAGFAQAHLRRTVAPLGFDEALLTTAGGLISEGAITNVGCWSGGRLVWPDAPMLRGTAMGLLEGIDMPQERRPLRVADLPGFDLVFLCNSHGVVPVGEVDGVPLRQDGPTLARLLACYDAVPWDPLD